MARYQPQGTRGRQPGGQLPARRQLPPPEPPLRQRALTAMLLGALSLIALTLGLGNLRRGVFVAVLALLFAAGAIWLGVTASRRTAQRHGPAPVGGRRCGARLPGPRVQRDVAARAGGVLAAAEHVLQLHGLGEHGDGAAGVPQAVHRLGGQRDQRAAERPVTALARIRVAYRITKGLYGMESNSFAIMGVRTVSRPGLGRRGYLLRRLRPTG